MELKQASRIYRTYKSRPNDKIETKTFIQVCGTYERYLKEVRNLVLDRDKEIEKLKKENKELKEKEKNLLLQLKDSEKELLEISQKLQELKKDRNFYKEIAMKGGQ